MNLSIDYYEILGLAFGAGKADIATSYRTLVKRYHPDINPDPAAEEVMKRLNVAYYTLYDDLRRANYNSGYLLRRKAADPDIQRTQDDRISRENASALDIINRYFEALRNAEYALAYEMLSSHDREYVTLQSFLKWRESVRRLFRVIEYTTQVEEAEATLTLDGGEKLRAKKISVDMTEHCIFNGCDTKYQVVKYAVQDNNGWKVFLGYRDLNEIARVFEDLSDEQERNEMARHWDEYCRERCRELDMLSLAGLIKASLPELYRCERYGQQMTVALFSVSQNRKGGNGAAEPYEKLMAAASALREAVRETDVIAYIGDGVFAALLVELKRRHAPLITRRIAHKLGLQYERHDYAYLVYKGGSLEDCINELKRELDS